VASKKDRLLQLAIFRKNSRWDGYDCIGDFHEGVYECSYVSPYTIGAHNVGSPLMILLQDWASSDVLNGLVLHEHYQIGHDPARTTNIRLQKLLHDHFNCALKDTYATNVFPFVKRGPMKATIPRAILARAARQFAIPQIEIVAPRLAVCLGKAAFDAVATAAGQPRTETLDDAISSPFVIGETKVWCQAHTGQMGVSNRGGIENVSKDWAVMAKDFVVFGVRGDA
jgi:uracil-DNA glycosylase